MKAAAEQANDTLANGDISQEQYDALQREIIETEQELQNLQREAEDSHTALIKLDKVGEALEKAGDKIAGVGTTPTTHVTAPIAAVGTVAVKTASDFDSAMHREYSSPFPSKVIIMDVFLQRLLHILKTR